MSQYPGASRAGVSPNRSPRKGKVKLFIVHHYAGTQDPESAWKRFMNANDRSVSPNYQVNADGSVFEVVPPDEFRAWTTGVIDHQAVTCETQNTTGAPTWGISRESHEAIARLVAWAAHRYGFPIQRGRVDAGDVVAVPGVVGHRETPAGRQTGTACPGPSMDLDWIVNRAQQIAGGSPADTRKEDDDMPTLQEIFNYQVPKYDAAGKQIGTTTLAAVLGWSDANNGSVLKATIAGIMDAQITRQGLPASDPRAGKPTTIRALAAWSDTNFLAVQDSVKQSVLDAIKTLPTGPGGSVNADAVAEKVAEVFAEKLAKQS